MRLAHSLLLMVPFFLALPALADGGCDFNQRFIGKKIMGYVRPDGLEGVFASGQAVADATKECMVQVFSAPNEKAREGMVPCPRFYMSEDDYQKNLHTDNYRSDYFTLDVLKMDGAFVQIPMFDQSPMWAKLKNPAISSINEIDALPGVYPSAQIFSKPDRAFPATPLTAMDDKIIQHKIRALFAGTQFEKKDIIAEIRASATNWTSTDYQPTNGFETFYADFYYIPQGELTTADGTRWLKAEERFLFQWWWEDANNKPPKPDKRFARYKDDNDANEFWTEALRIVYIPLRASDGTILNVGGNGKLYCD